FSSLERFIFSASVTQRNFRGKGQELRTSVNYSNYSKSVEVGFTEPYLFDKNIALGGDIYRRDLNSFNYLNSGNRNTTYEQTTTGFQIRAGVPLTEYTSLALRYSLNFDDVTLGSQYYSDPDGTGPLPSQCDPLLAGRYLCEAIGKRTTSSIGYSWIYDTRDNRIRPTRGNNVVVSQDFAGLGGSVKYIRSRINAGKWFPLGSGFVFSVTGEGGYIFSFEKNNGGQEKVRLIDRFFLGEPQLRGFDIRGVGPRVVRYFLQDDGTNTGTFVRTNQRSDDALGGKLYYLAHAEIEIPLGSGARELGLRPSVFVDVGAVGNIKRPSITSHYAGLCQDNTSGARTPAISDGVCPNTTGNATTPSHTLVVGPFEEEYLGDSLSPRLSVGFGVNWNSPFGPFRIDIAKALLKEPGDDTKLITFNIGTQF
ncbi:MAG: BamA/TamA family outer membrane protein, partial [Sphingobium sp.]